MKRAAAAVSASLVLGLTLVALEVVASPAGAAPHAPSACRLVTPAELATVTGRPAPPAASPRSIDHGRGSYCAYDISGGYLNGGPDGATLALYASPSRSGRRFIVGTSDTIAHDTGPRAPVRTGEGARAELGGNPGFRQLLVRAGARTLLLDVQVKRQSPVTDAELEAWLLTTADLALR